jgi:plastocyanin
MRRKALLAAAAAALVIAGCGGSSNSDNSTPAPAATTAAPAATTAAGSSSSSGASSSLAIAADPSGALKFTETSLTAKAGKVTINFTNKSSVPHAVSIEGGGVTGSTSTVTAGDASVSVDLKPGKYTFFCPVDGHRAAGMEGTITVS